MNPDNMKAGYAFNAVLGKALGVKPVDEWRWRTSDGGLGHLPSYPRAYDPQKDDAFLKRVGGEAFQFECWPPYSICENTAFEHLLDPWEGDYEIRRVNGMYRVELFRPSEEFQALATELALAVSRARLKALLRDGAAVH